MNNDDSKDSSHLRNQSSSQHKQSFFAKIVCLLPSKRQLKHCSAVFSVSEKNILKILLGIIILSFFWVIGSYYFTHYTPIPANGGEYVEGIIGAPHYINPVLSQTNDVDLDLSRLIFSSLLKYNDKRILIPDLATGYETNEDQTTYTVYLRKDAYWQGKGKTQVTARDVIFTLQKIKTQEIGSPLSASFQGIEIEMIDDFTIKFILKKPFAPFPSLLTFGILPEHKWEHVLDQNIRLAELNLTPIGSGPMQVKRLNTDKSGNILSITLVKNTNYYERPPYITQLTFKFYGSMQEAIVALERKEIDGLSFVSGKEISSLKKKNKKLKSYSLQIPQYTALFFNHKNNPILRDKKIRQALAYSINKQQISEEALGTEGQIIHSPILPGMLGFNEKLKPLEFNITKANDLLTKEKWKKISIDKYIEMLRTEYNDKIKKEEKQAKKDQETKDSTSTEKTNNPKKQTEKSIPAFTPPDEINTYPFFRIKKGNILKIKITTVDLPENIKTAKIIKNAWKQLGILTEIKAVNTNAIKNNVIKNREYETLLFGHIIGSDPDPYPFWHSSQMTAPGLNLSSFSNSKADKILIEARETKNTQKRETLYKQFQEILNDELPAIFLYNPTYNYLINKKILGITPVINIIIPADRFNNFSSWYIKTKREKKQ